MTAAESAVLAVVYAIILGLASRELKLRDLPGIFWKSAKTVGSVMIILSASTIFAYILTQEKVPQMVVNILLNITDNRILLLPVSYTHLDVQGSHGATIGRLDDELLFYLCSRGMSRQAANKMITRARLDAVCRRMEDGPATQMVQDYLEEVIGNES